MKRNSLETNLTVK